MPLSEAEDKDYDVEPALVTRRGIFKDTLGASDPGADYQLRPNWLIALSLGTRLSGPLLPCPTEERGGIQSPCPSTPSRLRPPKLQPPKL